MTKQLFYYSHRYGGSPLNLALAVARFEKLAAKWKTEHPDRGLWAPWFDLARAERPEPFAMDACLTFVYLSDGIVMDLNGQPMSTGMRFEYGQAARYRRQIVAVDGEDMHDAKP